MDSGVKRVTAFFRDASLVHEIKNAIDKISDKIRERKGEDYVIRIMDFCGTHEWTITNYGLRSIMPPNVELLAGPGCPVCITPAYYVDVAIRLAMDGVKVYSYGDVYKLPGSLYRQGKLPRSLAEAKAQGGNVEVVYSFLDAIRSARSYGRDSVFLAVGFETTMPATAAPAVQGRVPPNLKIINVNRLTPPIMRYIFDNVPEVRLNGVLAPGHVSTITGAKAWSFVAEDYGIPVVVAGFEPIDVMLAILEILRQNLVGEAKLVNEYRRAVTWEGNTGAQKIIAECCEVVDSAWRGIGFVPESGLKFREKYAALDALNAYGIEDLDPDRWRYDIPAGCRCAEVTLGKAKPTDCPMYLKGCTPSNPYGPCMVSLEGTCSVWARYGGASIARKIAEELGIDI